MDSRKSTIAEKTILGPDLTPQELFDHCLEHMRGMTEQSVDSNGTCMYRGMNGAACAIGACISDADYKLNMEGLSGSQIATDFCCSGTVCRLAYRMQGIHDDCGSFSDGRFNENVEYLKKITDEFGLKYEVPECD